MSLLNRPDKVSLDAYSDPTYNTANPNGVYNRFTNQLKTPILNAKGLQLLNANFINSVLQLNDNSQLQFFYYMNPSATNIRSAANLRCVRLYPSSYLPFTGFTAFTKNKYFNSVSELVSALNAAASTGGDNQTYNALWQVNQVLFSYDATTRKVLVGSTNANFIAPAAADDPFVIAQMARPLSDPASIVLPGANAITILQPTVPGVSMNARLGFGMSFNTRGIWWTGSSQQGVATSTGTPFATGTAIEADANPILLGSQNCSIYLSVVQGAGMDSTGRKNLIETVPIVVAPLNINSFSTPLELPSLSVPNEIYEITVEMLDDNGRPFLQPPNYNTTVALAVYY